MIGSGYVGLVSGACFAEMGNDVLCYDVDERKVAVLERGEVPIHEPGLPELIDRNRAAERMQFTADAATAVAHGAVQFIAIGTPAREGGSAAPNRAVAAPRAVY